MASKTIPPEEMTPTNEEIDNDSDTATVSYDDDESSTNSQYSYTTSNDNKPISMPILKYARLMGSLPRTITDRKNDEDKNSTSAAAPFANKVTSSTIGRVIIRPSQTDNNKHSDDINNTRNSNGIEYNEEDETDNSLTKVHYVVALGYNSGEVKLVDVQTGKSVLFGSTEQESGCWYVTQPTKSSNKNKKANQQQQSSSTDTGQKITNLSFDSTTNYLCAMNYLGNVAIFGPLLWGHSTSKSSTAASASFTLIKPPTSTVRFSYAEELPTSITSSLLGSANINQSNSNIVHPTCMVLDPSYTHRKEESLLVGYNDGQLKLSKLSLSTNAGGGGITSLFGGGSSTTSNVKKVDSVLYQGSTTSVGVNGEQLCGIESVTWRGSLVAWADSR